MEAVSHREAAPYLLGNSVCGSGTQWHLKCLGGKDTGLDVGYLMVLPIVVGTTIFSIIPLIQSFYT